MLNSRKIDVDSLVLKVFINEKLRSLMGCQVLVACRFPQISKQKLVENMTYICTFPIIIAIPQVFKRRLIEQLQHQDVPISPNKSNYLLSAHNMPLNSNTLLRCLALIQCQRGVIIVHGLKQRQFDDYNVDICQSPGNRIDIGLVQQVQDKAINQIVLYEKKRVCQKLYPLFGIQVQAGSIATTHAGLQFKAYSTLVHALKSSGGNINRNIYNFTNKRMRNGIQSLEKVVNFLQNSAFIPKARYQLSFTAEHFTRAVSFSGLLAAGKREVIIAANYFDVIHCGGLQYSFDSYRSRIRQNLDCFKIQFRGQNQKLATPIHKKHYAQLLEVFGFTDHYLNSFLTQHFIEAENLNKDQCNVKPLVDHFLGVALVQKASIQVYCEDDEMVLQQSVQKKENDKFINRKKLSKAQRTKLINKEKAKKYSQKKKI